MVASTSAMVVIPKLDELFAEHGTAATLITDNGPPFSGVEFKRKPWVQAPKDYPVVTTSEWRGRAIVEGTPRMRVITEFIRNYRATPHTTTGKAPAELLFKRSSLSGAGSTETPE